MEPNAETENILSKVSAEVESTIKNASFPIEMVSSEPTQGFSGVLASPLMENKSRDSSPLDSSFSAQVFDGILLDMRDDQVPIIFSNSYKIRTFGLENLHPFDVSKWGKILKKLIRKGLLTRDQVVEPKQVSKDQLLQIHNPHYLKSLSSSRVISTIAEVWILQFIPACILRPLLLKPLQFHVGGSILGVKLAIEKGWAINLGGGFHHCSGVKGGGFCFYADISLCAKFAFSYFPAVERLMIVDLDAHQVRILYEKGNGYETDLGRDRRVFVVDAFNRQIYPRDSLALETVRCPIYFESRVGDKEYLERVQRQLLASLENFPPHLIIYNAGTDCLIGDPLGQMCVTAEGIIQRDELVWRSAKERNIPILMLTSGGYLSITAQIIADSIENLSNKNIINLY